MTLDHLTTRDLAHLVAPIVGRSWVSAAGHIPLQARLGPGALLDLDPDPDGTLAALAPDSAARALVFAAEICLGIHPWTLDELDATRAAVRTASRHAVIHAIARHVGDLTDLLAATATEELRLHDAFDLLRHRHQSDGGPDCPHLADALTLGTRLPADARVSVVNLAAQITLTAALATTHGAVGFVID